MNKDFLDRVMPKLQLGLRRKVPQIIQTEAAECSLACLAMICSFHGLELDMLHLRQRYGISAHGATLTQLIGIAEALKLKSRPLSLDLDELKELKTPCILHWDFNHFVVLIAIRRSQVVIHDPAFGRRVLGIEEVSQHFTGIALELWPSTDFVTETQQNRLKLRALMKHVQGLKGFLLKIFCLSVVIEAINLLLPVGTQLVMDHVIIAEDHSLLAIICIGLIFFMLFRSFISMIRAWISIVMGSLIHVQWKAGLFDHMMKLPLAYFEKRKLGDIQSRFGSLDTIRSTFTTSIVGSIIDAIMSIGLLVMMLLYGSWLVWVVIGFTAVYVVMRLATYHFYRQASEERIIKEARAGSHLMETLYGIGTIKALNLAPTRAQYWLNLTIDAINSGIRITKLDMLFGGINTLISTLDQITILWLGANRVIDGHITLGMFVAFNAYRGQFSERAANLVNVALQLRMLSLHNERISDIALTEAEPERPGRALLRPDEQAELEVRDLYFQYDPLSKPVVTGLNLSIAAGESVALVGPSGLGKTTLMKLMAGLLTPTQGHILINKQDIHTVGLNNYRRCIACVLQEDKLFAGSIAENISGFSPEIDQAFMQECARHCNMHEDIMRLPMGYETLVSELGSSLSGGQKQRLLLARALYRRPSILFMDEATSHLDLENEERINKAIAALNITRIMIAHRPSTIAYADRVIPLAPFSGAISLDTEAGGPP